MNKDTIARLQQEFRANLQRWWQQMPGTEARYQRCLALMNGIHGSLHVDRQHQHFTDASWDSHHVRHMFGVRDTLAWGLLEAEMDAARLASWCGDGYYPDGEHTRVCDFMTLDIRMAGVLWLAERFPAVDPAEGTTWYCEDCVCGWINSWDGDTVVTCARRPWAPLKSWCQEHTQEAQEQFGGDA